MPGRYGPADVTVTLQDAPGGTARNIQNYCEDGIRAKDIAVMVESMALGDAWKERLPTGIRDSEEIEITGDWDTTATTGSHAIFRIQAADVNPQSVGRQLVIVFGDAKTWTRTVHISEYEVIANKDNIQKFKAKLSPTGSSTWT